MHRQKEEELRQNDAYWKNRLAKQEQDLQKTASILEKEYNETVQGLFDSTHAKFFFDSMTLNRQMSPHFSSAKCENVSIIHLHNISYRHART